MIRNAMFYLNQNKPSVYDTVRVCAELCRARGIEPIFFEDDREELVEKLGEEAENARYLPEPDAQMVDMLFVFGGDGTVLRALDMYVDRDIPILGINLGRLGFLLETQTQELPDALDMLVRGEYAIERRMMLKVEGMCNGKPVSAYATNEVSVSRGLSQRMIALDALVGGTLVDHYIADGVVLASRPDRRPIRCLRVGRLSARMCRALCSIRFVRIRCNRAPSCFCGGAGNAAAQHEGNARRHSAFHRRTGRQPHAQR